MSERVRVAILLLPAFVFAAVAERATAETADLTQGRLVKLVDHEGAVADLAIAKFVRDPSLALPLPDPTIAASTITLRSEDGDTAALDLGMSNWAAAGAAGWVYKDTDGGAVRKVVLKANDAGGRLIVKAKGNAYGAVALAGPESFVEVELVIGATGYCGRFEEPTSTARKNVVGKVVFKGPTTSCDAGPPPESELCDNGIDDDGDTMADCEDVEDCPDSTFCVDDGNPCTADLCMDGSCRHDDEPDSTVCDDEMTCTSGDACSAGMCIGTPGIENCFNGLDDDCDGDIDDFDLDCP